MRYLVFFMMLAGSAWPVIFLGEGKPGHMNPDGQRLTPQQAIVAARSKGKHGSSFQIVRELTADAGTRRIAEQSLQDAQTRHVRLYGDGILVDVLANGGFLVAEIDPGTDNLVALHLVSTGRLGRPARFAYPSESGVKFEEAAKIIHDTADFTETLLSTPPSEAASLESRFSGGAFPEYDETWDSSYFAIPHSVLRIKAEPSEYRELAALYGSCVFWPYRYALSLPAYAANPLTARQAAAEKQDALQAQFLRIDNKRPGFLYAPEYLRTEEDLAERIDWLRRLNRFCEETLKRDAAAPDVLESIKAVASIPIQVEAVTRGGDTFFATTASGVAIYWQRLATGAFAVKKVSEVEAEHP